MFYNETYVSNNWNFLSWCKGVRDTFNIKKNGDTGQDPLLRRSFGLQLSRENEGVSSVLSLVNWAVVDALVILSGSIKWYGSAVDDWHN